MKKSLLILFSTFFFISCEMGNIAEHTDYIGVWTNVNGNLTRTLEVNRSGESFYEERTKSGNSYSAVSQRILRFKRFNPENRF